MAIHRTSTNPLTSAHPLDRAVSGVGRYDERERPMAMFAVTYGVAVILLFFAASGLLPSTSERASSLAGMTSDANTLLGQAYQAVVWSFACLLMLRSWRRTLQLCLRMRAMLALSFLAPLSALWSQNPSLSFRRGFFLILGTVFASYLASTFSARDLAQIVAIAGLCAATISILLVLLLPSVGLDGPNAGAWQGIFHSKNGCGQGILFFMTPAIALRFTSRGMGLVRHSLILLAGVIIVMSNAKTAWILTVGYIVLIAVASWTRRMGRKDALLVMLGGVALLFVFVLILPYILPTILVALGKDDQLTGRLPLWASSLVSAAKRPFLGYGYQAFWTGMRGESLNVFMGTHFEIYQAQNGLLEIALELGLVGVALVLLTFFRAARDAIVCFQHGPSQAVNWYVGILALSVAYNIDEAFLAFSHSLPWLLYVMACSGLAVEARKIRAGVDRRATLTAETTATFGTLLPNPPRFQPTT